MRFRLDEFGRPVWPSWFYHRPVFSMGQGSFGGGAPASGNGNGGPPGGGQQGGQSSGQGQGGQPQGQGAPGQPQLSDLGQGFLGRVAPEHQALLGPYIQQWDAGVTRRFQDLHNQLRPFQELGMDAESLQHAVNIYQMLDENPQELVRLITEQIGGGAPPPVPGQPSLGTPPGDPAQQGPGTSPELQAAMQRLDTFEKVLEQLAQGHIERQSQDQQAQEDAELNQYLDLLKKEYGDFDENYVLAQMMGGMDGEQAVQAFQKLVQGGVNQRQMPHVPQILGGGGAVPQQQTSLGKASRQDVKSLVANIMASAAQNG